MATLAERKLIEGLEHVKLAEKCMKTSMFKWKADLEGAASEYNKAGVAFKNAKDYQKASAVYLKAADVQEQSGSYFHAAKAYESAALMFRDLKDYDQVADVSEKACLLYQENGTPDTAAIALERAAKILEYERPERAVKLYKQAFDVADAESSPRQCAEYLGKAGRILIRTNKYDEAVELVRKEIKLHAQDDERTGMVDKLAMGVVMIQLHRQDSVAAELEFRTCLTYPGFAKSEEAAAIQRMLTAYDEGDQEYVMSIVKSPLFRYMDNDFARLARDLKVPGGSKSAEGGGDDDDCPCNM